MTNGNNPSVPAGPAQPIKPDLGGYLAGITYGKQIKPIFALIHGPDGVGKTTFASKAPEPVFLGTENGSDQLDVARLPRPETLGVFRNQIAGLLNQEHPFKTVVIDSIDWLEPLIWRQVCAEGQVKTIEDYAGGFGKGYIRALEIWRGLLEELSALAKRFHVILIAHSKIKRFDDPKLPTGYDRYVIAINEWGAAAIRQSVDAVLFATFNEKVKQTAKSSGPGNRGLGEGERILFTEHRPAFDAKNRFQLPFELPLEWRAFAECVKKFYFGEPGSQEGGAGGEKPGSGGPDSDPGSAPVSGPPHPLSPATAETKGTDET
jgi:AAA domain